MLQSIRDHTQGWIAGTIVSLLILSFALWGIHSYLGSAPGMSVAAKVNHVEITQNELSAAYERSRRQLEMQYNSPLSASSEKNLKGRTLQMLIDSLVLKQAALQERYRISSYQVDNYVESIPELQTDGRFSNAKFQQLLAATLFTAREFLDIVQTSLLIEQPRLGFVLTSFALPNEVKNTMALVGQERNIRYVVIPFQHFSKEALSIPEDKILSYYKAHENDFKTLEQVSVEYLAVSINDLLSQVAVDEQKLKDFYKENLSSFTQPAQWKLETILVPINGNSTKAQENANKIASQQAKDFISYANSLSAMKASDSLQGWSTIDKIPLEFQQAVLGLTKPNQLSSPIKTKEGFIIIKLDALQKAEVQSFDAVKNKVKELLTHQLAQEQLSLVKDKLADITYQHPDSLEPAAQKLNLKIKTSELFSKDQGGKDISANPKVRAAAYSSDVLNLQNNSDVIQVDPSTFIVLRVKSHTPATLLSLKTVEPQIIEKLKTSEIEIQTAKLAEEIKKKLDASSPTESVVNQYHLQWIESGFIGRRSNKIDSALLDLAFTMPKQAKGQSSYGITKVSNGYAVVNLLSVKEGSYNEKDQYKVFAEQIQNSQGLLEYELYKQSLINNAKIVIEN